MSFYDTLKSLGDKDYLPRRLEKGSVEEETHAGCPAGLGKRFGYSPAGLGSTAVARIRKKMKTTPHYFQKNQKLAGGGCAPSPKLGIVPIS